MKKEITRNFDSTEDIQCNRSKQFSDTHVPMIKKNNILLKMVYSYGSHDFVGKIRKKQNIRDGEREKSGPTQRLWTCVKSRKCGYETITIEAQVWRIMKKVWEKNWSRKSAILLESTYRQRNKRHGKNIYKRK